MKHLVVHVLTVADSLGFIDTVVEHTKRRGYEVVVVTSPDPRLDAFGARLGVRTIGIEMPRRVSLTEDWIALQRIHRLFTELRPTIVHAHTPKGALLGTLAAHACRVPVRLYQMRGLAYVTAKEPLRTVLLTTERLSIASATHVICQSRSLRDQALQARLVTEQGSEVVLEGSNGVDAQRFTPDEGLGAQLRAQLGISPRAQVIGFVGRLVRDKGIPELIEAFDLLNAPDVHLVLAGPWEPRDPVDAETRLRVESNARIHTLGHVKDPRATYAASDFVVLPSHREGFPNVPLEAGAMAKAVVTTRVPGCIDAVVDETTGLIVPVNDPPSLAAAMQRYLGDTSLTRRHGEGGQRRVKETFARGRIADAMVDLYDRQVAEI